MSLTNEQIKAIVEAAERKNEKWISHFHGSAWWGDHNLSDLSEILALRERVAELERERAEVARKAFVDGANWWAQCEQNDTLHLDEHEAASEYVQCEYGTRE
jgi:hypothetical protein